MIRAFWQHSRQGRILVIVSKVRVKDWESQYFQAMGR